MRVCACVYYSCYLKVSQHPKEGEKKNISIESTSSSAWRAYLSFSLSTLPFLNPLRESLVIQKAAATSMLLLSQVLGCWEKMAFQVLKFTSIICTFQLPTAGIGLMVMT